MSVYKDSEGVEAQAFELAAPTVLNTIRGEEVGEAGQFVVILPDSKPALLDAADFNAAFTLAGSE